MYRKTSDFIKDWKYESEATLKIFEALTEKSLNQKVTESGRSLGFLAWHVTLSHGEMMHRAGLVIDCPVAHTPMPSTVKEMIDTYRTMSKSLAEVVLEKWPDSTLPDEVEMYSGKWTKGGSLSIIIRHQTHHRGQMTVLMRQAGLIVPGAYGPAKEEWASWGMPAME